MSTATPQLPTVFMVLAEAALSAGGHHPTMHEQLADVASFVLPILTVGNLVGRDRDVLSVALDYGNAPRGGAETSTRAEILAKLRELATNGSSDFAVRDAAFEIQCHAAAPRRRRTTLSDSKRHSCAPRMRLRQMQPQREP